MRTGRVARHLGRLTLAEAIQRYDQPRLVSTEAATRREINRLWLAREHETERGNLVGAAYLLARIRRAELVQRAHHRAAEVVPINPGGTDPGTDSGLVWWAKMWNAPG